MKEASRLAKAWKGLEAQLRRDVDAVWPSVWDSPSLPGPFADSFPLQEPGLVVPLQPAASLSLDPVIYAKPSLRHGVVPEMKFIV